MVLCFVPFCTNRAEGLRKHSFHKFPQSDIRKRQWLRAMKRDKNGEYFLNHDKDELSIKSSTKVCSAHFKPMDFLYNTKKKLSNTAVPSIFKWTTNIDFNRINEKKPSNSDKRDHKACSAPCNCCQIVIEEIPEVEEIIIERQIEDDVIENKEDIKEIIDKKPVISNIITEENMANLLDFDIKEEYLDIPSDTNSDLAQLGYCADANYNNGVTDLVSYNCDVTGDPTSENNELMECASANTAPANCDYTEDPTTEINDLIHCASANSTKSAIRNTQNILVNRTETVENTKCLQHIKAHIIQKEQILAKCNFGSDNPSLTGNPTITIPIFTIERFKANDQSIEYYTGLPSYELMQLIFTYVLPSSNADHVYYATKNARLIRNYNLSGMNQFFMTVLRLKQNLDIKLISDLFSVNETIVQSVFRAWVQYLHNRLSQLIRWPNRENLIKTQNNVVGGLYITKLNIENECKKGLIMLDPNFNLMFVSKLFPNHLTVKELMQQSFFLREITRKFELEELYGTDVIITGDRMLEVRSFVKWKETDNIDIVVVEVTDCKEKNLAMLTEERMNVKQVYEKLNIYAILKNCDSSLYETHFFNEIYTVCMFLSFFQLI